MQLADAAYQERDRLVINHLALVKKVAVGLVRRLPAQVEMNELIGEGVVGLLDAARRYKPASGVPFEAFAARRVRGSMLDALRAVDPASRRTRRMERNLKATCSGLRQTLGRDPNDVEIADAMGLTKAAYTRACRTVERAENSGFVAFEEAFGDDQRALARAVGYVEDGPDVELERTELRMQLVAALGKLHERERKVLALYYEEELTMAQIARVLGLSESRISQLRSLALSRLRTWMRASRPQGPAPVATRKPAQRRTVNARRPVSIGITVQEAKAA